MSNDIMQAIEQMGREKGIDVEIIISALEDAISTASRKHYKSQENILSRLNRKTGEITVFSRMKVVDEVENPGLEVLLEEAKKLDSKAKVGQDVDMTLSTKELGRIEAQAAKQVIFQKVREAEREIVYIDFAPRVGELMNGTVKRFERGDIILDIGKAEAILPRRFQSRAEAYSHGDRVRAIVLEVSTHSKGPQVVVSRIEASLLVKLFEMEVPEIYDGTVRLANVVREPGDRSKVAVTSREKDVDPVGACVGMKGSRVQAIIRELRGEKIDIVQWSEDLNEFGANALNPAKVSRVTVVDPVKRILEVVVDEMQLSLAIGKRGQNVRLGSKLIGWRIDIKSEEEKKKEAAQAMAEMSRRATSVRDVEGITARTVQNLIESGYKTVGDLESASVVALMQVPAVGKKSAERIKEAADAFMAQAREEADRPTEADEELSPVAEPSEGDPIPPTEEA